MQWHIDWSLVVANETSFVIEPVKNLPASVLNIFYLYITFLPSYALFLTKILGLIVLVFGPTDSTDVSENNLREAHLQWMTVKRENYFSFLPRGTLLVALEWKKKSYVESTHASDKASRKRLRSILTKHYWEWSWWEIS